MHSIPRRVVSALVVTLVLLGALEGAVRIAEPRITPPERTLPLPRPGREPEFLEAAARVRNTLGGIQMVNDDASGWNLPADRVVMSGNVPCRINTLGIRGPELGPRAAGEERLYTLGDSSVFGDGVPEASVFSSVAARLLGDAWGVSVSGVIGGVPGHDSSQSVARLKATGEAVQPTWVVIANLWSDVYKVGGFLRAEPAVQAVRGPLRLLATYRVARQLLAPVLLRRKVGWIASMDADVGGGGGGGDTDSQSRVLLRDYIVNLRSMADLARSLGARPAFLVLPAPIDLDPAGPPENVRAYREAMRTVAAEYGAPLVDAPAWFASHGGTIGHFADQVHPNELGHELIGEALAASLAPAR